MVFSDLEISSGFVISTVGVLHRVLLHGLDYFEGSEGLSVSGLHVWY